MHCYQKWIAITICFAATTASAQESTSRSTLADRLDSLRAGWGASAEPQQQEGNRLISEPAALPIPQAKKSEPINSQAKAINQKIAAENNQLPRVDPRDLLPQNWRTTSTPAKRTKTLGQANGSTRARLLRDTRNEQNIAQEERPPVPRAGSVLSSQQATGPASIDASQPNRTGVLTLTPNSSSTKSSSKARSSWATSALSRSIAAEVAQSMAPEKATPLDQGTETEITDTVNKEPVEISASEETASVEVETPPAAKELTIEKLPAEEGVVAKATDKDLFETKQETIEQETAAIVTTDAKPITKLPFSIGDGTEKVLPSQETTMTPAIETVTTNNVTQKSYTDSDQLLLTQKMPLIVYQVAGPRKMVVGREATYRVTLDNRGDASADQLDAIISVPGWAEIVSSNATIGDVNHETISEQPREIFWKIPRLAGSEKATLDLRLVPRAGRPIELGVQWTHRPVGTQTMVEVQEPKLAMTLTGPDEVLFGKPQSFNLTINNPGTGTAEQVTLLLTPPGSDASKIVSQEIPAIAAGESRTLEIELTAREAGQLTVNASVNAIGDVSANVSKEILCRKAELAVDWRGPSERYTGAPATYFFRVRNPGTAVAPNVVLTAQLPEGFELISSDQAKISKKGLATFQVGSLRPGDDRYYEMKCLLSKAGDNEIVIGAVASDDTQSESVTALTNVIALADLKLDVLDPKGPVATGEEIEYQIRVTNRGTSSASEVKILGLFSEGIEPHHVDGSSCSINDGRVTFDTINSIPAGAVRTFTIRARADQPGTHLFRAEVLCRDLEIKLAAEETTRFFEDEVVDVASQPGSRYGY